MRLSDIYPSSKEFFVVIGQAEVFHRTLLNRGSLLCLPTSRSDGIDIDNTDKIRLRQITAVWIDMKEFFIPSKEQNGQGYGN